MSAAHEPTTELRTSFFIECEELLEALQDGLQAIDNDDDDDETINVMFRAVHSIKGGAGAFGLQGLVRFAHRFEAALDAVRAGRLEIGASELRAFFKCADHLSDMVHSQGGDPLPADQTDALLAMLDRLVGEERSSQTALAPEIDFEPVAISLDLPEAGSGAEHSFNDFSAADSPTGATDTLAHAHGYTIFFKPLPDLFKTGNDPMMLLRSLAELGDTTVTCDTRDLPTLENLTPDLPHLSWTITLHTEVEEAEIHTIFEFVEGLCELDITRHGAAPVAELPLPEPENLQEASAPETPWPNTSEAGAKPAAPERAEGKKAKDTSAAVGNNSVVRVDLDRIERLVNLVGELVINQAMLSQSLEDSGLSLHSDAMNGLEEFHRLTRDIQDSVMMIRAQPVKSLFQRMSRIVRETSASVEKDVRLITEGENTEVDKTVIERLADPLTHMIRNAVDHGLESTEDRIAAGKDPQGRVTLSAAHRSGRVVIEVSDDGLGIDRPRVRRIAVEKGLIPDDADLSDSEIDSLLFLPSFSTATEISDVSGRGVGMDVVRTAIQALGGRITITSQPGAGTCFSISLPLTLAVLDGMVIEVARQTLVLPLNLVLETVTVQPGDVQMLRAGSRVVRVRDSFVSLIDLGLQLGYRARLDDCVGAVVLLIAHEDGRRAALLIDNILDQRQVVIKGLDDSFYRAPGIAAATILGDGQIALILDPSDLIGNALCPSAPTAAPRIMEGNLA